MSRHGVVLVFFDLPVGKAGERRAYRRFRREMIKRGYFAVQESIYVRLLRSTASSAGELIALKKLAPKEGSVLALPMSLNQFRLMSAVVGKDFNYSVFSDDLVVL